MTSTAWRFWLVVGLVGFPGGCRREAPPPPNPLAAWSKPLAERTPAEILSQLVGTWKAADGSAQILAFDPKGRVAYIGKGTQVQAYEEALIAGQVKFSIDAAPDGPTLHIKYPAASQGASASYRILQLVPEELALAVVADGRPQQPVTFIRFVLSVIDEEEPAPGGAESRSNR